MNRRKRQRSATQPSNWAGSNVSAVSSKEQFVVRRLFRPQFTSQIAITLASLLLSSSLFAAVFSSTLPTSRSVQVGQTASFFATMITDSPVTLTNCQISVATTVDATFSYQTTDPLTNAPTGTVNTPVDIAAGGSASFVLTLTPNSPISTTDIEFNFTCDNDGPAPVVLGLNTLKFTADANPVPDIIALAATVGGSGITELPIDNGLGFFTVATNNIGASGTIDVIASVGPNSANADQILVCETDAGGACINPPTTPQITLNINGGSTPTFGVFVSNGDEVGFDPGNNRIFLTFSQNGQVRGSTSTAFRGGGFSARGFFGATVSDNTVQARCIACHINGGVASATRLRFQAGSDDATEQANFDEFENFVSTVPDGANRILSKVQGALAHGGGVQISQGSQEFADLSMFNNLRNSGFCVATPAGQLFVLHMRAATHPMD